MKQHPLKLISAVALLCFGAAGAQAAEVGDILKAGKKKLANAQASQRRIDKIAAATDDLVTEFNQVNDELDDTKVYNRQKELVIRQQRVRVERIKSDIAGVQDTQRSIPPLIERMIDAYEQLVALDMPFDMDARKKRVERFRNNISSSEFNDSEKFRQVLAAYLIELDYSNKLADYVVEIDIDGEPQEVNMLRLGRTSLVYQTKDKSRAGVWDPETRRWVELDAGEYRNAISDALRISRKTATIDIMKLPVKAPEAQ